MLSFEYLRKAYREDFKSVREIASENNMSNDQVFLRIHELGLGRRGNMKSGSREYRRDYAKTYYKKKYEENRYDISRTDLKFIELIKEQILEFRTNGISFTSRDVYGILYSKRRIGNEMDRYHFSGLFKKSLNDFRKKYNIEIIKSQTKRNINHYRFLN